MRKKTIGIIGGMGPKATVELFQLIVNNTNAYKDSEHIHIIIDNNPQIPDRTSAILYGMESPLKSIVLSAKKLRRAGCDFIVIPCNTSHYYADEIQRGAQVKLVNMIEETAKEISLNNYKTIGLLATTGTINTRIYENTCYKYGIRIVVPSEEKQKRVMSFIYDTVKAGKEDISLDQISDCFEELKCKGAEAFLLGCTELSVANKAKPKTNYRVIDALQILALRSIVEAGYDIRK